MKGTALNLMVPNVGSKWKRKKDAVNTFKVSTTGGLDVEGDKRACYATKEAAVFAACIRGILEYLYKRGKTRNGVPTWVDHILPLH
jgi:hypothetical protein